MPAYRVFDFEQRGKIRKNPFAQVVTHEGQYPFREISSWSDEAKTATRSFIPSLEAQWHPEEVHRYNFSPSQLEELQYVAAVPIPSVPVTPAPLPAPPPIGAEPLDGSVLRG